MYAVRLEAILNRDIQKKLHIGFDALKDKEKVIFGYCAFL